MAPSAAACSPPDSSCASPARVGTGAAGRPQPPAAARRRGAGQHAVRRPVHVRAAAIRTPMVTAAAATGSATAACRGRTITRTAKCTFRRSSRSSRSCASGPTARTFWRSTIRNCSTIRSPTWRNRGSGRVTEKEATALRSYLLKGGFVIFDDFRGLDWDNLQDQMAVVLPEANWIQLDGTREGVSLVLRDRSSGGARPRRTEDLAPSLLGVVREQRSEEAADGDRQREQRHQRVLGVLRHRASAMVDLTNEVVQVRRELRDLRADALKS